MSYQEEKTGKCPKMPTFSARAVSAVLTRAGLKRKSRQKGSCQLVGDFYIFDFVDRVPLADGPPRVEVKCGDRPGGGDVAAHRTAVAALRSAGYEVEDKISPPGYGRTGTFWVVGPAPAGDKDGSP